MMLIYIQSITQSLLPSILLSPPLTFLNHMRYATHCTAIVHNNKELQQDVGKSLNCLLMTIPSINYLV